MSPREFSIDVPGRETAADRPDARPTREYDFTLSTEQLEVQERVRAFVRQVVLPHERVLFNPNGIQWSLVQDLRARARDAGIFGPQIHRNWGGLGLDWRTIALAFEEAGVSLLGPIALNCAAPDDGNIQLLEAVADAGQREQFLAPLARGTVRSCFAMTEPAPGAGSDPSMLMTRAERRGTDWVLNGRKWYITGAADAAFAIVVARTSDDPAPRSGATLFVVPMDTPGLTIVRVLGSLDHASFLGGHAEIRLTHCRVGPDAVLGAVGSGFDHAQSRLVRGRLTHAMRWLGAARRAHDSATSWVAGRESHGKPLGEHQMVQAQLADSAIELHAARLMIRHAAWTLDTGGDGRAVTQMTKVYVSEAVNRIVDRSIQICGARGVSDDDILGLLYREIRPFRIYDGPSEVHRAAIARRLLRRVGEAAEPTDGGKRRND